MRARWSIDGEKDPQLVRSDWSPVGQAPIDGVTTRQITSVLTSNGYLTEVWRADWALDDCPAGHVFQRVLEPWVASAWHGHEVTTDRLFCAVGRLLVVLYDARSESPTHGNLAEYRLGNERRRWWSCPPVFGTASVTSETESRCSSTLSMSPTTTRILITTASRPTAI